MRTLGFVLTTLFLGLLLQILCNRYLSIVGVSPYVLLLLVVSHGFLFGPIMAELLGFFWGMMSDALGVHMFGLHSLLFAIAGYVAGTLRRRVASDRATAQIIISIIVTAFYGLGSMIVQSSVGEVGQRFHFLNFVLQMLLNSLVVTLVFSVTEHWTNFWGLNEERL